MPRGGLQACGVCVRQGPAAPEKANLLQVDKSSKWLTEGRTEKARRRLRWLPSLQQSWKLTGELWKTIFLLGNPFVHFHDCWKEGNRGQIDLPVYCRFTNCSRGQLCLLNTLTRGSNDQLRLDPGSVISQDVWRNHSETGHAFQDPLQKEIPPKGDSFFWPCICLWFPFPRDSNMEDRCFFSFKGRLVEVEFQQEKV